MNKDEAIKISIIIPIYNVSDYIEDCLKSVYRQTYPYIEVILVNDASPDNSMTLAIPWITKLQERKYTVQVINHPVNKGLSAARNTGIRTATTNWIYFLDSDDELTPECINLMVEKIKLYPLVDFVIGNIKVIGKNIIFPLTCHPYVNNNKDILNDYTTSKWYVMACNRLYKRSYLLQNNLFFKEGIYHEDDLYSFRLATTAQAMATVYENTYIYKLRFNGSITSQRKLKNFEDMLAINAEKYKYILQKYQSGDFSIAPTYCIDIAYWFFCILIANKCMSMKSKCHLIKQMKNEYNMITPFIGNYSNIKYKMLFYLFKCPSALIYLFISIRLIKQRITKEI